MQFNCAVITAVATRHNLRQKLNNESENRDLLGFVVHSLVSLRPIYCHILVLLKIRNKNKAHPSKNSGDCDPPCAQTSKIEQYRHLTDCDCSVLPGGGSTGVVILPRGPHTALAGTNTVFTCLAPGQDNIQWLGLDDRVIREDNR